MIVYDGDCIFCQSYVRFMRLRETAALSCWSMHARVILESPTRRRCKKACRKNAEPKPEPMTTTSKCSVATCSGRTARINWLMLSRKAEGLSQGDRCRDAAREFAGRAIGRKAQITHVAPARHKPIGRKLFAASDYL